MISSRLKNTKGMYDYDVNKEIIFNRMTAVEEDRGVARKGPGGHAPLNNR